MSDTCKIEIEVQTFPKFMLHRVIISALSPTFVIGMGWALGSTAMQWFGFLFMCLFGITAAHIKGNEHKGMTIQEAREHLDKLEEMEVNT